MIVNDARITHLTPPGQFSGTHWFLVAWQLITTRSQADAQGGRGQWLPGNLPEPESNAPTVDAAMEESESQA